MLDSAAHSLTEVRRAGMGSSTYDDVSSLRDYPRRDLQRVDHLGLRFGGAGVGAPRVSIDFNRKGDGVSLEVHGDDERKVKAVLDVLSAEIDEHALFPKAHAALWQSIAALSGFLLLLGLPIWTLRAETTQNGTVQPIAFFLLPAEFLLLVFGLIFVPWIFTPFELMPGGQQPRLSRFYGLVVVPLLLPIGLWVVSLVWHP